MSNMTNVTTVGPGSSCSFMGSRAPDVWRDTNFTGASCSVPNCLDNRDALETCCTGGTISTFNDTLNTRNGTLNAQWLYCNIDANATDYDQYASYNPEDRYQAYQDCLVREGAGRMICNPAGRGATSKCYGDDYSISSPYGISGDNWTTVCGVNTNNENAGGALWSSCQSSEGTLRAEQYGCYSSCSGDETLQSCLNLNNNGFPSVCSNRSESGGNGGGNGSDESGASFVVASSNKMTLVGVLVLSAVVMGVLM